VSHHILPADQLPIANPAAPAAPGAFPVYKWGVVAMLWFICFFNYADRQSISSVLPVLGKEFGFDKQELGLIASAFMWVYAFGAPFAGFVGDRVRRKDLIMGGCLFWSAITAMTGWCSRLWHFVTVRALEGFGETFYFPASMSLVSDYHDRRTRSRAMAFHQSSVYIGTIGGGWLGAWFAEKYGWRVGFYFFGLSGLLLALVLYGLLREPRRGEADIAAGEALPGPPLPLSEVAPTIFRSPVAILLMVAFVGANFVATIFLTWTPTFLVEKFDFTLASAGLHATLYIQLASAVSGPASGFLSDSLTRSMRGGRMFVQALGLIVGAYFVFAVGSTKDWSVLFVVMTVFGLCKGVYDANIFASLFDVVEPRARATAAGLMNSVGWGGGALGPLYVGWMTKHGPYENQIDNMSLAISRSAAVYVVCAAILLAAALYHTYSKGRPVVAGPNAGDHFIKDSAITTDGGGTMP
jgi:MFS family permease